MLNFIDFFMRYTLDLTLEWQLDQITLDPTSHRVDVYLRHSGEHLVCPETGEIWDVV